MKKAILQVYFLTNSLFPLWFHAHLPQTEAAYDQQCHQQQNHQPWNHLLFNLTYLHQQLPDTRIFQHNERDDCPSFHSIFNQDHISAQRLSLCPWDYVKSFDADRYPSEMFYARCSCKRCVVWGNTGLRHECRAHYHAFNVVRRVCTNGQYRYYQAHEYLPIACVCSHEHLRVVGSIG